jgi:hypothetical protein
MLLMLVRMADEVPEDDDVVAGSWGAIMLVLLIVAVVVLFVSFRKQMRKVQANREAGVFGDEPEVDGREHGDDEPRSDAPRP